MMVVFPAIAMLALGVALLVVVYEASTYWDKHK